MGQKGRPVGSVQEVTYLRSNSTEAASQTVDLSINMQSRGVYGQITSTFVGPATEWRKINYTVKKHGSGNDRFAFAQILHDDRRQAFGWITRRQQPDIEMPDIFDRVGDGEVAK